MSVSENVILAAIESHATSKTPLHASVFRYGSDAFFAKFRKARSMLENGSLKIEDEFDKEILSKTDLGEFAEFNGMQVPLDFIIEEGMEEVKAAEYQGKQVDLNKPKRGGPKKFYVYVKNDKGNVIKVNFGAQGGGGKLSVKLNDPEARKRFADRHDCENKTDKTTPGYWSCRLPRYAKSLKLSGGGQWW